jgi:mitochondrial chaperone BCS1
MESVVLDADLKETIVNDIKNFYSSYKWYEEKGVPYRRGYLLHGPPGTGKTSFTCAVAGALNLNICYLNLASDEIDDDSLNSALNESPSQSIILLEDIDGVFVGREAVMKNAQKRGVSFSGLLNALDGVRSQEGRLVFMTTNHPEKLDAALLRPGRADFHAKLDNASVKQIGELFERFYPDSKEI